MAKNIKTWINIKTGQCREALLKRGFEVYVVEKKEDVLGIFDKLIEDGQSVTCGGSMSLRDVGAYDYLKGRKIEYLDRYKEGLSQAEIKEVFKKGLTCDVYLTSTNAVTESGELYNVDGAGNRVASMIYGPESVVVVMGYNKIVKDIDAAVERNKEIAAPVNCMRLDRKTPCVKTGKCMDCASPDRICNYYTVIRSTNNKRIKIVLVNEQLGY